MEPQTPTIFPTSGLYRPPLSVTLSAVLSQGDKLYYIVEESDDQSPAVVRKRLYSEPFLLLSPGRVRVTAFVWRPGFGESQSASNIFMLDDGAKPTQSRPVTTIESFMPPRKASTNMRSVVFTKVPHAIRSLETFSVSIGLQDEAGFSCASSFVHPLKIALSAEVMGETVTSLATIDISTSERAPKLLPPPFVQTSNVLISSQNERSGVMTSIARSGKGGSWNAFADSTPCISGNQAQCASVRFRVHSLARAIVGLHLGLEDVASEMSWRSLPFSFHFSADLSDPTTVPAFRIYESGRLVEDAGTEEFAIGDEFAIRVRPNGDVSYLRNGNVLVTSNNPSGSQAVFSIHVRVAAQLGDVAISSMSTVADGEPFSATIDNLLWKPRAMTSEAVCDKIVLRAWIAGTDFVPATTRVVLKTNCIPRWAFAALNLASMFAVGTCGSQSSHVGKVMGDGHQNQAPLQVVEDARSANTATLRKGGTNFDQFLS
jgi:hypothetical protein